MGGTARVRQEVGHRTALTRKSERNSVWQGPGLGREGPLNQAGLLESMLRTQGSH